jgi:hypothetical protein
MSLYYGVIGNRDHIKIHGEKRPFWEFLDVQPDGWLCSLAYRRKDFPESHMIWDCGAWSYKNEETPKLPGIGLITPSSALKHYIELSSIGDILIAPDHMLIDGVDVVGRKKFNRISSKVFLNLCPPAYLPMATIHGFGLDDRINNAKVLHDMGYNHLALGGMAARAAQPKIVFDAVAKVRDAVPDVWLHVLGLSAPKYAKEWERLGVQSFDGSSHFKQAFTAGKFYEWNGEKLLGHHATKEKNGATDIPECDCVACSALKEEGIDTRTYGSNENNMGRAAHNMNQLMKAIKCTSV